MEENHEMQYAYEMVIAIVADIVVEYLKETDSQDKDNATVATDVNVEGVEGQVAKNDPEKTAA